MEKVILSIRYMDGKIEEIKRRLEERMHIEVLLQDKPCGALENALILTDDGKTAQECVSKKWPCAAILHDKNRQEHFPMTVYCLEKIEEIESDYFTKVYQRAKGIPWTILETQRLKLREITLEDVPRLYELYADPDITKYMENLYADPLEEMEYTREYIKNVYEFWGYGIWLMIKKDTGEIIGRAGVESKEGEDGLELGFMLGTAYQHQGYAYEGCHAILQYAGKELEEDNIRACVHRENKASIKLCERLGMERALEQVGALQDEYVRYYLKRPLKSIKMH